MDYALFFERTELAEEGRQTFYRLHERASRPDFAEACAAARAAFDAGDEAFGRIIADLAEREGVAAEQINLYLYLRFAEDTLADYRRRRIDDGIFYDTFFDITAACRVGREKVGIYGIPQKIHREWLRHHLCGRLYRLGRLQFEMIRSKHDLPEHRLKAGDVCLSTHIPGYLPLDDAACEQSYAAAKKFFRAQYGIERCVFFCHSWLLHPWMREDLRPESQIRKFSEKYRLLEVTESRETVIHWVFSAWEDKPIADFPRDTSLRRAAIARMEEGRPLGYALGVRE